ncbi:uncharacterized protein LOC107370040 [Tetranychus urticae]|uniref:Ubiquitin-like domain-containing protein n=1 Tax=Tetranychus urticae TaxID=32264 RepID=T1JPX9_TETUR|nr:uncharacterized protein LOC107370040 [Tetranychus urticae]
MLDTPSSSSSSSPLQSPTSQPISPPTSSSPPLHIQPPISGSVTVTTMGSTFLIKSPSIPVIAQSPVNLTSASAPLGMSLTESSTITDISKVESSEKCSSAPAIYREAVRSNNNDEINGSTVSPVETQFPFKQNIESKADIKKRKKDNVDAKSDFTESEVTTPNTELRLIESRLSEVASGCHSAQPIQDFQLFPDDSIPSRYSSTSLNHYGYFPGQDGEEEEEEDQINNHIVTEEEARGRRRGEGREMDRIRTNYGSMMYTGGHRSVHQIPIYVETFSGTTFEIQILPQETIYCLKMKLQQEEGILVTQQHLIWQGEELKDDFTLEEYGIGFGAILRLVLELRGGPLNNFGHNLPAENYSDGKVGPEINLDQEAQSVNETSSNDHGCDQRSDLRQSGFVFFQDGNEIRMYSSSQRTTGTTGTDRSSIGSADPFGKFNETGDQSDSMRIGLIDIARINEQRQKENDVLRFKMREIQSKMKSLALKRCKKLPETNSTKLPLIVDVKKDSPFDSSPLRGSSSSSFSYDFNRDAKSKLIFPPLVSPSPPAKVTLQPIVKINDTCEGQTERRRSKSKLIEQFNKKYYSHKCKSNSAKSVRLSERSINKKIILDPSLTTNYENELSLTVMRNDSKDRPKTTPMTGLVNYCYHNDHNFPSYPNKVNNLKDQIGSPSTQKVTVINLNSPVMSRKDSIKDLGSVKSGVKSEPSGSRTSKDSISLSKSKSKTLPPVKNKSKLSTSKSKNRCFTCNKKLGLATRYDCRCGQMFCTQHRYSETHDCTHDYKSEGRRLIALNNPVVKASKLPKI